MKRKLTIIAIACASIVMFGAKPAQQTVKYYIKDEKVQEEAINKVTKNKEYHISNDAQKALYEKIMNEAFTNYFSDKKAEAKKVCAKDELDALNDSLKNKVKEINKLKNDLKKLERKKSPEEDAFNKKTDSIAELKEEIEKLKNTNSAQTAQIAQLEENNKLIEYIKRQEAEKREALERAYASCNRSLENIGPNDDREKAVREYVELYNMLGQDIPEEQQDWIDAITATCSVAKFYQKANDALSQPYKKSVNDALIKESKNLGNVFAPITNKDQRTKQQGGLEQIVKALENENLVIKNFRNGILAKLEEFGSIPDADVAQDALNAIEIKLKAFNSGDPNARKDSYNPLYVHINQQLETLRKEINKKAGGTFVNENDFMSFLNRISDSLGE